jgi:putative hydrolase of the HAD superfamily
VVAKDYHFSNDLTQKGMALLKELKYEGQIEPFTDYSFVRDLPLDKFLVTTGFLKLQQSKIAGLKVEQDFKEIHIVDPSTSNQTKKDVFANIIKRQGYAKEEVLVVGDDLNSELKAAQELGVDAVLYNKLQLDTGSLSLPVITSFKQLQELVL